MKTTVNRITAATLVAEGFQNNPNCYISSGYFFCTNCNTYRFHYVLSKEHDHRTVCNDCHTSEHVSYEADRE